MVSVYTILNYVVLGCLAIELVFSFINFCFGPALANFFGWGFNVFVSVCLGCAPFGWL